MTVELVKLAEIKGPVPESNWRPMLPVKGDVGELLGFTLRAKPTMSSISPKFPVADAEMGTSETTGVTLPVNWPFESNSNERRMSKSINNAVI